MQNQRSDIKEQLLPFATVQFASRENGWTFLTPPDAVTQISFRLRPLPDQILEWLCELGQRHWQKRRRCLAALLLVHVPTRHWTPRLPRQQCRPDRCTWQNIASDFPDLMHQHALAGSYQTRSAGQQRPGEYLPPIDGLHIVHELPLSPISLRMYMRTGRRISTLVPREFLVGMRQAVIKEALPRLTLA
jgi:hypothetical protein